MNNLKELSIIIVNYNTGNLLLGCVKSIFTKHLNLNFEIIVVDNASKDQSLDCLKKEYSAALIIQNKTNLGFAKAVNQALNQAKGRFILLLNPDTVIIDSCFDQMISFLDENPEAGACGPAIYDKNNNLEMSCHYFPRLIDMVFDKAHLNKIFSKSRLFGRYRMSFWAHDKVRSVDWITGACLMVRSKLFKELNGLDPRFFMFCEDIDLCLQIKNKNHKIFYLPQSKIVHYKSGSSVIINNKPPIIAWQSLVIFWEKYHSRLSVFYLKLLLKSDALIKMTFLRILVLIKNIGYKQKNNNIAAEVDYFKQLSKVLR